MSIEKHSSPAPVNNDVIENTIRHLATLSPLVYEWQRQGMAEKLGVRVSVLDAEVAKLRPKSEGTESTALVEEVEPHDGEVSGREILDEIHKAITDHIVLREASAVAITLWVVLTYVYDAYRILPLLAILSPEKRCGKTTLLEVLMALVNRAFPASNLTPALTYRVIEKCKPCLLIDEADTFLVHNDELRGVINSGHTRKTAFVPRTNPDTLEPERFSTWGPKAIAMIKGASRGLPDTLADRSVKVELRRKLASEAVKKLPLDFDTEKAPLRSKCARWANDHMEMLRSSTPTLPSVGNDRASDNWHPLVAIADCIGGEWPELARTAMTTIERADTETDSVGPLLLSDIREVFKAGSARRLWSQNLVEALTGKENRPWAEWRRGKPITTNTLARLLKPFGITSRQLKIEGNNKFGYRLEDFEDAFARYLPPDTPVQNTTPLPFTNHAGLSEIQNTTTQSTVVFPKRLKATAHADGSEVVFENQEGADERYERGRLPLSDLTGPGSTDRPNPAVPDREVFDQDATDEIEVTV